MKSLKQNIFNEAVNQIIAKKVLRDIAVKQLDRYLYNNLKELGWQQLRQEKLDKYFFMTSIVNQARKNLDKGVIKPAVMKKMAKVFVGDSFHVDRRKRLNPIKEAYREKYGDYPPQFLVLSPGKGCNLHCTGCYALQSKLFKNGRKWQKDYGFDNSESRGNILMPCSIRDHYEKYLEEEPVSANV